MQINPILTLVSYTNYEILYNYFVNVINNKEKITEDSLI